jgi:hypothetical protein
MARLSRSPGTVASLAFLLAACSSAPAIDGPGGVTRALTGAHTRVVWVQASGGDLSPEGDAFILMGLDTDDGRGERVILGERGSYVKPLFTARGNRIVFSRRAVPGPPEVFVVDWDGANLRRLGGGFALDVWQNPVDDRDWVYVGTDNEGWDFAAIMRFPIDAPDRSELVWNRTMVSSDTFEVSPDGRHAAGLFPWPAAGVAELPNRSVTTVGHGCWTSLASVRGPLLWYFDGAHRNLTMVDLHTDTRWRVSIDQAPGFDDAEVYHPRWSNHSRFMTLSGPYNQGGSNQVRSGGRQSEVYIGRFSTDYGRIEAWARVTTNDGGDSYPDVWIDLERSPHPRRPRGQVGPASASAAASGGSAHEAETGRIVVDVRLVQPGPVPTPQSILPYRHALVVNDYEVVKLVDGTYGASRVRVAQWAVRDSRVLAGARKTAGAAFTLTLERYDAHPELEGERLIGGSEAAGLPLYYDVGAR